MLLAVGMALGGLLVGFGHVGDDTDRSYRGIKVALADSLRDGQLPFWSDRFGLGWPLIAESHVAAFYPPNWAAYSALEAARAFDLLMWLHYLGMAASAYLLARTLGAAPWGAATAGVAYALSGHLACHSPHEPFYSVLAYMPLILALVERFMATGRAVWALLIALALGVALVLGHFQYQFYTILAALFLAAWRTIIDGRPWRRLAGVVGALAWGLAVAAIQLALTAEIAAFSRLRAEKGPEMAIFSYPPWHAVELALPLMFARVPALYWNSTQATTRPEACLYVGTAGLILAIVGLAARGRSRVLAPWLALGAVGLILPAMTRLWLPGYLALLQLPGFGLFRCPGRYTILTTLALCLLAGIGLDRAIDAKAFRRGLIAAGVVFVGAVAWAVVLAAVPRHRPYLWDGRLATTILVGAASWAVALAALVAWRRGAVGAWAPAGVLAVELGLLFYVGTGRWGWHRHPEAPDTVLGRLARVPRVGRVAGSLFDIPIRAGLAPATPYVSFGVPPHEHLFGAAAKLAPAELLRVYRRYGVTHGVRPASGADRETYPDDPPPGLPGAEPVEERPDPALDAVAARAAGPWRVERYPGTFRAARVVARWHEVDDAPAAFRGIAGSDDPAEGWVVRGDYPAELRGPRAERARVVDWDGHSGIVEHDGPCDVVLARSYFPGWTATLGDGPPRPVFRADGGLQAIHVEGSGRTPISTSYRPTRLAPAAAVSLAALAANLLALAALGLRRLRAEAATRQTRVAPEPVPG
jgi:hypothetical protein